VKMGPLNFNPVVTGLSAAIIWGFVIWACVQQDVALGELLEWRAWVAQNWSWFYIVSQDIWIVALLYIMTSKYKNIRLGPDDEKPEFSDITWFAMLFSCGVAVGLFYYSVAEPMWHYNGYSGARFAGLDDNERGTHSLMVTWFHWGLHGWIPYTVVGALLGITTYRRGLPMTMRFALYPLIGEKVYGPIGDIIDISSIVCTLFGVCTSLGLGVMQINKGLERLDKGRFQGVDSHPKGRAGIAYNTEMQIAIIWVITAMATVSVVSGLRNGIRRISQVCFVLGMFLLLSVLFMGHTEFILNLIVETFGYYLWYLPKIAFHTDAFELTGQVTNSENPGTGGQGWMDAWTIFYWGWWISWAPFVGMFMARISKGRTLGEFIMGTLLIPSAYSFFWLGTFGAEGLLMDRQAAAEGMDCSEGNIWGNVSPANANSQYEVGHPVVRLWCHTTEDVYFEQLATYGGQGFGDFLAIISIVALVLYFITSSDSGSLVIDIIAANGTREPPVAQKIFWAITEGAAATALLMAGKADSLNALKTASIVCGLPYTFVLFWFTQSLLLVVKEEGGDLDIDRKGFSTFLFSFDFYATGPFSSVVDILLAGVAPFLAMGRIAGKLAGKANDMTTLVSSAAVFVLCIMFLILRVQDMNFTMIAAALYVMFTAWMGYLRNTVREHIGSKRGSYLTDIFACLVFYPWALPQMEAEIAIFDKECEASAN